MDGGHEVPLTAWVGELLPRDFRSHAPPSTRVERTSEFELIWGDIERNGGCGEDLLLMLHHAFKMTWHLYINAMISNFLYFAYLPIHLSIYYLLVDLSFSIVFISFVIFS